MCRSLIPDVKFNVLWQRFRFDFMLNEYFIQVKFGHPKWNFVEVCKIF